VRTIAQGLLISFCFWSMDVNGITPVYGFLIHSHCSLLEEENWLELQAPVLCVCVGGETEMGYPDWH